jgi:hypothetical protein
MKETEEVSIMLRKALCETGSETEETDKVVRENLSVAPDVITSPIRANLPFSDEQLATLNMQYYAPLAELLTRQVWSSEELAILAKRHKIMPSGMVDAINTWADGTLGDILVEDGSEYKINLSLVEA